jgi:FlaA1/EpsC-like NDP-sugar epimerase
MLVMLCVFTGILIASSFYRMALYTSVYGYTGIRMRVITFLSLETALIFVTLLYLLRPNFDFLKRYIYISVVFYMIVNITSSAYVVGRLNVNRLYEGHSLDVVPLCQSTETAGLLAEIYENGEFINTASYEQKEYVYRTIIAYGKTEAQPWQNTTILNYFGLKDARAAAARITPPLFSGKAKTQNQGGNAK